MQKRKPPLISTAAGAASCSQPPAPPVRWEGDFFEQHSLALVNREICARLMGMGADLSVVPRGPARMRPEEDASLARLMERRFAPLSKPAAIHVRHFYPPRFERPAQGRLALILPWEYHFDPDYWIDPLLKNVDEVWCYSRAVRDCHLRSGAPAERLFLTPLGADTDTFKPDGPEHIFTNEPGAARLLDLWRGGERPFIFLFVGGAMPRKGIDILLDAFRFGFSRRDRVALVVKDTGTATVYRGQTQQARLMEMAREEAGAPVVYIERELGATELAALYRAADCLVLPYRGEGFGLPVVEAMASGKPVIVTAGGSTDDFVDEEVGWRVPAEVRPMQDGHVGGITCVQPPMLLEPLAQDLADAMWAAVGDPAEARRRGAAGRRRAVEALTWDRAAETIWARVCDDGGPRAEPPPDRDALLGGGALKRGSNAASCAPGKRPSRAERRARGERGHRHLVVVTGGKESLLPIGDGPAGARQRCGRPPLARVRAEPTLSLCMIVKDEERVLAHAIVSARAYVDEIIVADTGSVDQTVQIATKLGCVVRHFAWTDSFSAARNESLRFARGDWIFWMDADDTLPAESGAMLRPICASADDETMGFRVRVRIPPGGGEYGETVVDHIKLFRNGLGLRFEGRIHEQILPAIDLLGGRVELSGACVIHSGYDRSAEGQARKRERDFKLLRMDMEDDPQDPFHHFNLGMTYFHLGRFAEAVGPLERSLELSAPHASTVRKVYSMLARSYRELGSMTMAKERLEQGLRLTPFDPELLARAGELYQALGNYPAAESNYLFLLSMPERGHIDSLDVGLLTFKTRHNLGVLYAQWGRLAEAVTQFAAAVQIEPAFVPGWLGLCQTFAGLRRFDDGARAVEELRLHDALAAEEAARMLAAARYSA